MKKGKMLQREPAREAEKERYYTGRSPWLGGEVHPAMYLRYLPPCDVPSVPNTLRASYPTVAPLTLQQCRTTRSVALRRAPAVLHITDTWVNGTRRGTPFCTNTSSLPPAAFNRVVVTFHSFFLFFRHYSTLHFFSDPITSTILLPWCGPFVYVVMPLIVLRTGLLVNLGESRHKAAILSKVEDLGGNSLYKRKCRK